MIDWLTANDHMVVSFSDPQDPKSADLYLSSLNDFHFAYL